MLTEGDKQKITRFAAAQHCTKAKPKPHLFASLIRVRKDFEHLDIQQVVDYYTHTVQRFTLLGGEPEYEMGVQGDLVKLGQVSKSHAIKVFHDTHATWFHNHVLDYEEPYLEKTYMGAVSLYDMNKGRFV